ncbi:MAG: metalloregulator ArsR/SmtB family transcription factor [Patescibacteria group bacterium]
MTIKQLERVLKALANKRRLEILEYLKNINKASVGDIASKIKLSLKATSKHLSVLFSADIVEKEQVNVAVFYRHAKNQDPLTEKLINLL